MNREESKWEPTIRNCEQPIAFKKLLRKACERIYRKYQIFPLLDLKDDAGVYGKLYAQFVLLAKDKPYGNIISVHRDAVAMAMLKKVKILFWLDSAGRFYELNPEDVIKHNVEENRKGPALMYNFSMKLLEGESEEIEVKHKKTVVRLDPEKCETLDKYSKKK